MADSRFALRPSAAHRWVECYGSVALEESYPQEEGESAREGTAGHWVATEMLAGRDVVENATTPNGVVVSGEMLEGAALFCEAVFGRIPVANMRIEREVTMERIHPANGGTPDVAGMGFDAWVLHVIDYKYGRDFVDAFENWQCIDYVVGVFDQLVAEGAIAATAEAHITVEITIVQPRNFHRDGPVRSWRVRMGHLRAQVNRLTHAAEQAMMPNAETRTGPWCLHCDAAVACATLQQSSYRVVDLVGDATPFDLTPTQAGSELRLLHHAAKLLEARIEGLEVEATKMLSRGDRVPYYSIEHVPGNLAWLPEKRDEVAALGELLGVTLTKPPEVITPTQAKDALKKAGVKDDTLFEAFAFRPRKAKLLPFDSKQARKLFGENKQ